jgi:teichoic acid transport system permease protein
MTNDLEAAGTTAETAAGTETEAVTSESGVFIRMTGEDPYLVWRMADWNAAQMVRDDDTGIGYLLLKIFACLAVDAIVLIMLRKAHELWIIPREIFQSRKMIMQLAKNDFKTRYAASYLGIFWAFVQPVITVLVYWAVFDLGLKVGKTAVGGIQVPFALFLISGMVPWFFFSDALNGATGALTSYSYLVKKVVFNISMLPIVKVISAMFVHLFFIVFAVLVYTLYGYYPTLYMIQMLYYTFALFMFVLGLGYLTCAIVVFFRDLSEIINIVLQIGVWATPIMWDLDSVVKSGALKNFFRLNPMYYIVQGYRDSLINRIWFWERPALTLYYWCVTFIVLGIGMHVFRRLKVHFADVL